MSFLNPFCLILTSMQFNSNNKGSHLSDTSIFANDLRSKRLNAPRIQSNRYFSSRLQIIRQLLSLLFQLGDISRHLTLINAVIEICIYTFVNESHCWKLSRRIMQHCTLAWSSQFSSRRRLFMFISETNSSPTTTKKEKVGCFNKLLTNKSNYFLLSK